MNFCMYRILFIYVVIRRPVTTAHRVQVHHSQCGICGGQFRTGACSPNASVYSCHRASTNAYYHVTFFCKTSWQSLGTCFGEYIYIYIYIYFKCSKEVATLSTHEVNRNRRIVCSLSLMSHLRIIEHFSIKYGIVPAD